MTKRPEIGLTFGDSRPVMPSPVKPDAGAPNVVVVVFDDLGFAQLGSFGSDIKTPAIDGLAAGGLRYNRFHVTAVCSATRASLLTGRNHHAVGMGYLPDMPLAFPGYTGSIPKSAAALPRLLRDAGYSTFAVGKWHLIPRHEISPAGPFDRWPLGMGFERYYGFPHGETDQWVPDLAEDNHYLDSPPAGPDEGYHVTEDMTDAAIRMVTDQQYAAPGKPFFLYFAPGAMHSPHQVSPEWVAPYEGKFDIGWDRLREKTFANQIEMGIVPPGTVLTERPPWVANWDDLTPEAQRMHARQHEVYAGFLTHTDAQIGRLVAALDRMGVMDNTLLLILSDNGASAEGGQHGTFNVRRAYNPTFVGADEPWTSVESNLAHMTDWGGMQSYPLYSWGWAWAGNTPLRLWKRYAWLGGTRTPLVVNWPAKLKGLGGGIRQQFCHAVDILPTVLDACGVEAPETVDGISQQPIDGASLIASLDDPEAPDPRRTQYFEMMGSRSLRHGRWKVTTDHVNQGVPDEDELMVGSRDFGADHWSLFDLDEDFSESKDVSTQHPEVARHLQDLWFVEAGRNNVMPISDVFGHLRDGLVIPPAYPVGKSAVFRPGSSPIHAGAIPFLGAGFTITAECDAADRAQGVVFAIGDWHGGCALYAVDDVLKFTVAPIGEPFTLQSKSPLGPGRHRLAVRFAVKDDSTGELTLSADGETLHSTSVEASLGKLIVTAPFSGRLRLGYDEGFPVCDGYQPPFQWQGAIHEVTVDTPGIAPALHEEAATMLRAD